MKVGVEGTPLYGNLTGVGQYSSNLLAEAAKLSQDTDFEVVRQWWFFRKFQPVIRPTKHLSYRLVNWIPPLFYYQLFKRLGWAPPFDLLAMSKYDAFIFFNFVAFPLRRGTKSLVVVYDLSYALHPQYSSPKNIAYLNKFVPRSINKATKVITISENSKKEIVGYYHVPESKVTVINPAVDHNLFKPQSPETVSKTTKKYGLDKPYILSVCTLEPRKNLIGVLSAFELLPDEVKTGHSLVLVGGKGWLDGELQQKYDQLSQKYSIIKTGYVPRSDLPGLYSGASVFVYPAFYEGFGMPPLEAMACGVPVITSDNSSLPEVVGDAAICLPADDSTQLSRDIARVLSDTKLASDLKARGMKRAAQFTWTKSASQLLDLLAEMANE
jgi:glycosyltransferase involved in cell wall biosynthesis